MHEEIEERFGLAADCIMRCRKDVVVNESCPVTTDDAVNMLGCSCYEQHNYVISTRSTSSGSCPIGGK